MSIYLSSLMVPPVSIDGSVCCLFTFSSIVNSSHINDSSTSSNDSTNNSNHLTHSLCYYYFHRVPPGLTIGRVLRPRAGAKRPCAQHIYIYIYIYVYIYIYIPMMILVVVSLLAYICIYIYIYIHIHIHTHIYTIIRNVYLSSCRYLFRDPAPFRLEANLRR